MRLGIVSAIAWLLTVAGATSLSISSRSNTASSRYIETPLAHSTYANIILPSSVTLLKGPVVLSTPTNAVIGAGVVVCTAPHKPLYILTVAHVAETLGISGFVRVTLPDGEMRIMAVKIADYDDATDLALLATVKPWSGDAVAARLADRAPRLGDTIWIVGAPGGIEWSITRGVVSNKVPCATGTGSSTCYRTDAALTFGYSGGGAYDSRGDLIGIADYVRVEEVVGADGKTRSVVVPGSGAVISWNTVGLYLEARCPSLR